MNCLLAILGQMQETRFIHGWWMSIREGVCQMASKAINTITRLANMTLRLIVAKNLIRLQKAIYRNDLGDSEQSG